jgi:class 3 adenylate cyclase/tetratricopeptide (TPR) repeat protein
MERRLAAILTADLVGFARLMGADESAAFERLKRCETEIIEPLVKTHRGRIVKRMGDGYLIEFASVVAAVECALAWQAAAPSAMAYRIGVNTGEVIAEGGDVYGDGVNIAARLEALAEPGGVVVSNDVRRHAAGRVAARFDSLGVKRLKNIAEPIRVFRVAPSEAAGPAGPDLPGVDGMRMARLLLGPLRPLGGGEETRALAQGVTETLAAALAMFESFHLVDPTAAEAEIAARGPAAAGRMLGATYVVDGSLQVSGGRARVSVGMIESASGRRVWSTSADFPAHDPFALQDDVAAMAASALSEAVTAEYAAAIEGQPDDELDAYETFVRCMRHLHAVNPEDNAIARRLAERALELAPGHQFPELARVWTYCIELAVGWRPSRPDALEHALASARKALRRHPRSAEAHRLASRLHALAGDHDAALAHAARAVELNPYHTDMIMHHGITLARCGDIARGLPLLERAVSVNPYAPSYHRAFLALACFVAERPEHGLAALRGLEDDVGPARAARIANLVALGRREEAAALAQEEIAAAPDFSVARTVAAFSFRDEGVRARLAEALRGAGLPG